MNHIELTNQEIEIIFENCESIYIDMWAIKALQFDAVCDRYIWSARHKDLSMSTLIDNLYLTVDLSNYKHFHHTNRLIRTKSVEEDGKECIERLKNSDDITHIYINGKCFMVQWNHVAYQTDKDSPMLFKNAWQHNSILTTCSDTEQICNELTIEIKEPGQNEEFIYTTTQNAETD